MRLLAAAPALLLGACTASVPLTGLGSFGSTAPTDPVGTEPGASTASSVPTTPVTDLPSTDATEFDCHATLIVDDDIDGTVDLAEYEGFDAQQVDWLLYLEDDFDDDGVVEWVTRYTRNADGQLVRRDGPDGLSDYTYNSVGDLVLWTEDGDRDGVPEYSQVSTWEDRRLVRVEVDDGADGTVDASTAWTYDAAGRLATYESDDDGDGGIDERDTYAYDGLGRPASIQVEFEPDDPAHTQRILYGTTYTDPVLLSGKTEVDYGGDGSIDQRFPFESDAAGELTYYAADWENDGGLDQELWYTYDAAGHLVEFVELDYTAATEYSPAQTREYRETDTFDGLGRRIERRIEAPPSSSSTSLETWTFGGTCPSP